MVCYPVLVGEMAKREVSKKEMADRMGICYRALNNRLNGKVPFTWPEVCIINSAFFPDIEPDILFSRSEDIKPGA